MGEIAQRRHSTVGLIPGKSPADVVARDHAGVPVDGHRDDRSADHGAVLPVPNHQVDRGMIDFPSLVMALGHRAVLEHTVFVVGLVLPAVAERLRVAVNHSDHLVNRRAPDGFDLVSRRQDLVVGLELLHHHREHIGESRAGLDQIMRGHPLIQQHEDIVAETIDVVALVDRLLDERLGDRRRWPRTG